MKNTKEHEIEYLPLPHIEEGEDPVTTLIKRLATVARRWANEELSGRQRKYEERIDY